MKTVWINVALREGCEDPDGAEGLWEVTLDKEYPEGVAAGVAKDVFHQSIGISVLDDFIIDTLHPTTEHRIAEDENYVAGSMGSGEVERIDEPLELP